MTLRPVFIALALLSPVVPSATAQGFPPLPGGATLQRPGEDATPAPAGTAMVRGRITISGTGQPLRGVHVRLTMTGAPIATLQALPTATTNDAGEYELAGLAAGRYTLVVAKPGFFSPHFERRGPNEATRPVEVAEGQVLEGVAFQLARGGVLTGQVVDSGGEPVTGAFVQVLEQRWVRGWPRLAGGVTVMDRTDDLGQFRIHGIPPGSSYLLAASVTGADSSSRSEIWSVGVGSFSTFYPGTASATEAQPLRVEAGTETGGLVVTLVAPRLASIAGVLRGEDGEPAAGSVNVQQPLHFSPNSLSSTGGRTNVDGTFRILDLPPGTYDLRGSIPGTAGARAQTTVVLNGTDVFVPLTLTTGRTARGRYVFESGAPPEDLRPPTARVRIETVEPEPESSSGAAAGDWTFEVTGLSGQRIIRPTAPPGWMVKAVRLGNTDVTDVPVDFDGGDVEGIEVVLTDRLTEVSGVVRDAEDRPAITATIVLFADDPAKWMPESRYITAVRPDQDGGFRHTGLPAGRYMAVALDSLEPGEETNPATLEQLRREGTSFTLEDGETHTLDLSLAQ